MPVARAAACALSHVRGGKSPPDLMGWGHRMRVLGGMHTDQDAEHQGAPASPLWILGAAPHLREMASQSASSSHSVMALPVNAPHVVSGVHSGDRSRFQGAPDAFGTFRE